MLILSLVLGGSSFGSSPLRFVLGFLCIPLIGWALLARREGEHPPVDPFLLALALGASSLLLLHLAPLPADSWSALPGREALSRGIELTGAQPRWLTFSLDPAATVASLVGLLPVAAVMVWTARTERRPTSAVGLIFVSYALLSLALGLIQAMGPNDTSLYLHPHANRGLAVGFFSNANHFATMLLAAMPVAAALLKTKLPGQEHAGARMLLVAGFGVACMIGSYFAQSVAGFALLPGVLAASLLITVEGARRWARLLALALPIAAVIGLTAAAYGASDQVLASFGTEPGDRTNLAATTSEGAIAFWPVGSGIGSFPRVYPLFEASSELTFSYANHAHNDYLEIWLEAGLPGVVLALGFIGWWLIRSADVWRRTGSDAMWGQAASVLVGIFLAHSLVDYPLRTPALATVFAFFTLLLARRAARATVIRA